MHIRPIKPNDLPDFVTLCLEHARYERADIGLGPAVHSLEKALFDRSPRLRAWVAEDDSAALIGFASATLDYSTWHARSYLHLDCLFVREHARGFGIGRALVDTVVITAREMGVGQVQWQTPSWNDRAQRFYDRLGASRSAKVRYTFDL